MAILTQAQGYLLLLAFAVIMTTLTLLVSRDRIWTTTGTGFLLAGRRIKWYLGAMSIAASWIWAPALFVSVQKAYELGLPGIFWFTAPNVLALVIFAFLGPRIRTLLPAGYTFPDWIRYRLGPGKVHSVFMIPFIWYQIMAITVQIFVGGMMLNFVTGIPLNILMVALLAITLAYSMISGLRASIVTDFLQMAFIVLGIIIIVPAIVSKVGIAAVVNGLGGLANNTNIFDPKVAFSFGIVTSIGLIAGAISDQQYWQRCFAIRRDHLVPSFVIGGLMFGIVPIALSLLGFLAANPELGISLPPGTQLPMIGIATVIKLLSPAFALFFVVMLLSGLASTLDSGLAAISSLYAIDMAKITNEERMVLHKEMLEQELNEEERNVIAGLDEKTMPRSRAAMIGIAAVSLVMAFVVRHYFPLDRLWWIFNGVASCFVVPTVLSLYYDRLSARGALYGILASLVGLIPFIYGNWIKDDLITVLSALYIVAASIVCCLLFRRATPWVPDQQSGHTV